MEKGAKCPIKDSPKQLEKGTKCCVIDHLKQLETTAKIYGAVIIIATLISLFTSWFSENLYRFIVLFTTLLMMAQTSMPYFHKNPRISRKATIVFGAIFVIGIILVFIFLL